MLQVLSGLVWASVFLTQQFGDIGAGQLWPLHGDLATPHTRPHHEGVEGTLDVRLASAHAAAAVVVAGGGGAGVGVGATCFTMPSL